MAEIMKKKRSVLVEQSDKAIIIYYLVIVRGRGEGERKEGDLAVSVLLFFAMALATVYRGS